MLTAKLIRYRGLHCDGDRTRWQHAREQARLNLMRIAIPSSTSAASRPNDRPRLGGLPDEIGHFVEETPALAEE